MKQQQLQRTRSESGRNNSINIYSWHSPSWWFIWFCPVFYVTGEWSRSSENFSFTYQMYCKSLGMFPAYLTSSAQTDSLPDFCYFWGFLWFLNWSCVSKLALGSSKYIFSMVIYWINWIFMVLFVVPNYST